MKNKYLKKVFITCGISVFAGVLVFGVNAAFGAPSHNPPGDTVGPTFSGLTVNGTSNFNDDILANYIEATGMDLDSLAISSGGNGLHISGVIKNSLSNNGGNVYIDDGLQVTGDVDVQGKIQNSTDEITLDGATLITQMLTVENNLDVLYKIYAGSAKITGTTDLQGSISNSIGNVKISDNLDITGSILDSAGPLILNDDVNVWGDIDVTENIVIQGDITVGGEIGSVNSDYILKNVSQIQPPTNSTFTILGSGTYAPSIEMNSTTGKINIGGGGFNSIEIDDNGKLTAPTIGTYKQKISGKTYVYAGNTRILSSPSCGTDGQIISCNAVGYYYSSGWYVDNDSFVINKLNTDFSTNTCQVAATNGSTSTKYLQAIAICYYPNE